MALAPSLIERLDWSADRLAMHRVELKRDDGPAKLKRFVALADADSHHTGRPALSPTRA
jgi:hypothetical protein